MALDTVYLLAVYCLSRGSRSYALWKIHLLTDIIFWPSLVVSAENTVGITV